MNLYGSSGVYCWIKSSNGYGSEETDLATTSALLVLLNLYIPLWISAIFIIIIVVKVIKYVKSSMLQSDLDFVSRLKLYPIVLIVCWTPATINRILSFCTGQDYAWMVCLHIIFSRIEGLLHMIVYGMTGLVQVIIKEKVLKRFFPSQDDKVTAELSQIKFDESRRSSASQDEAETTRALHQRINSYFDRKRSDSNIPTD